MPQSLKDVTPQDRGFLKTLDSCKKVFTLIILPALSIWTDRPRRAVSIPSQDVDMRQQIQPIPPKDMSSTAEDDRWGEGASGDSRPHPQETGLYLG